MRKLIYILLAVLALLVMANMFGGGRQSTETDNLSREVDPVERSLRLDAICKIGWVAGNSENHAIWPEVRPYVGVNGEYYRTFVQLRARGEDAELAAQLNVNEYDKCRKEGSKQPFSEPENMNRIRRILQIAEEIQSKW